LDTSNRTHVNPESNAAVNSDTANNRPGHSFSSRLKWRLRKGLKVGGRGKGKERECGSSPQIINSTSPQVGVPNGLEKEGKEKFIKKIPVGVSLTNVNHILITLLTRLSFSTRLINCSFYSIFCL
jgi:hypothetical protein